jgi:glycosyltransferase involved in cell wall biosynthesis
MMRVAYICMDPGVPVFGQKGASVHVQEVIRALLKCGAKVDLFALRLGGDCPSDLKQVKVHTFPELPKGDGVNRERIALSLNQLLRLKLESETFDLIYERYSLWSYAAIDVANALSIPSILEVNAPLIEEQKQHRELHDLETAEMVAARVFSSASAVICVSKQVAEYVKRYPNTKGHVHVLSNGVNVSRFRASSPTRSRNDFTIGFVGTLKPWHGVETLLESFHHFHQRYPKSRLLIVGDGPERERLEAIVEAYRLVNAVTFTGAVSPESVPELLSRMNVAVAPYPALENFYFSPLKILEYMAGGVPVVASRIGQIPELLDDGVSGLLYPPDDVNALTLALCDIFHKPALAERLAKTARQKVEKHYSWDATVTRMLELAGVQKPKVLVGV